MRSGLEILAAGAAGGGVGALGGYLRARLAGDDRHRGTDAVAGLIFAGTLGLVIGAVVFS